MPHHLLAPAGITVLYLRNYGVNGTVVLYLRHYGVKAHQGTISKALRKYIYGIKVLYLRQDIKVLNQRH